MELKKSEVSRLVVILVLLVIALIFGIVFLFTSIIQNAVSSFIDVVQSEDFVIPYESVVFNGDNLELVVERKALGGDLTGLLFVLENADGESYSYRLDTTLETNEKKSFIIPISHLQCFVNTSRGA